jgi:hypothetical protein
MTNLINTDIDMFEQKLKILNGTFLKTIKGEGGLLSELEDIKKKPNNLGIPKTADGSNTYNTQQFANFIRNIVNFNINNYNTIPTTTNDNMIFIQKTTTNGVDSYSFNENVKKHIIETLKVINVFVDILEAYKNCIDNEQKNIDSYASGYTNDIIIEQIELVSNTTRFYNSKGTGMYPSADYKNVGYIRPIVESTNSPKKTVLYLSIESFYNGMTTPGNKYDYNNMFTKTKLNPLSITLDIIDDNILGTDSKTTETKESEIVIKNYARQIYSGIEDKNILPYNLTLDQRNKNLIVYLLKILFNLDPNFRKQCVYALYYYYKFVQLYSTLVINVCNVMYTNVMNTGATPLRIETLNMSLTNMPKESIAFMSRVVSGIEIKTEGSGYTSAPQITFTGGADLGARTTITQALMIANLDNGKILTTSTISIANGRGSGYVNNPIPTVDAPSSSSGTRATALSTIVPIAFEDNQLTHDKNIDKLSSIMTEISTSLNIINSEFSKFANNESIINPITISTSIGESAANKTIITLSSDNNVIITITKTSIINSLKNLISKDDIINNFIVYDNINKHSYSIKKIIESDINGATIIYITLNAVFNRIDIPIDNIDTKIFRNNSNDEIAKPTTTTNVDYTGISSTALYDFLQMKKKDLNTYKNEYIYNRDDIARLDENIRINSSKVEHQNNLYDTQYNKNVFLTRQIISYNTIIAVIFIILIVINILNFDQLFIKTISLICLGVVLLLFVVYFISNITYVEAFTMPSVDKLLALKTSSFNMKNIYDSSPTQNDYNTKKVTILNDEIKLLNKNFLSFFEKLIITLPTSDNIDFYKEVKGLITNDKNQKVYTNKVLLIKRDQSDTNMDTLKYEMENNKLYIVSLLIATIIFISIYNMYINYVSNDRFLSLTVFVCIIILIVIAAYYVIRSNRRVRTFYKNIYWGPETSTRF